MKRYVRLLCLCALAVCLCLSFLPRSRADFGDFSGDYDYGDWGDDDWDWDDDDGWDWDGDWDFSLDEPGNVFSVILVIVVVFGIPIAVAVIRSRGGGNAPRPAGGEMRMPTQPIEAYAALDPAFDAPAVEAWISNLYIQMQQCWEKKDITSLRPYLSNVFYEQSERQLDAHRRAGNTNYIVNPTVLGVKLLGYRQENGMDVLVAEVRARIIDYTLNDATGELIRGSRTAEKFMRYGWELVRPTGQTSRRPGELETVTCPHCGAPVNINQSAQCEYCGSVLTVSDHDFVLNSIVGIAQMSQ